MLALLHATITRIFINYIQREGYYYVLKLTYSRTKNIFKQTFMSNFNKENAFYIHPLRENDRKATKVEYIVEIYANLLDM